MKDRNLRRPVLYGTAALILALAVVARAHHAPLIIKHLWNSKAGNCTLAESFEAEAISRLQLQYTEAIKTTAQVVKREGAYSLVRTSEGEYWVPASSVDALAYDLAEQKRDIYRTGVHLRSGDIVLDAGANIGVFTRRALWAGAAKVVAIEPAPENLECLRRTFAPEIAAGRVVVYPKGIWDREDVLKLSVNPADSAQDTFVRDVDHAQTIDAPLTTVDKLAAELGLERVDFIKMDIEGAERRALVGAHATIARYHPRMALCIYHIAGDEVEVPRLAVEAYPGYRVDKACFLGAERTQPEVAFFY